MAGQNVQKFGTSMENHIKGGKSFDKSFKGAAEDSRMKKVPAKPTDKTMLKRVARKHREVFYGSKTYSKSGPRYISGKTQGSK